MVGIYSLKNSEKWDFNRIKNFSKEYGITNKGIHVVGTNGKGSTSKMIQTVLSLKTKTGLYTSPHLISVRERIRIDEKLIKKYEFYKLFNRIYKLNKQLSFFETLTCMAFEYFKNLKESVIEAGMGGRYDATNIMDSKAVVITSISYDHTRFLGNTKDKIAKEKAEVIKQGIVVSADKHKCIEKICKERGAELFVKDQDFSVSNISLSKNGTKFLYKDDNWEEEFQTSLIGFHQAENAALAIKLLKELKIRKNLIKKGLKETKWLGRFQIINKNIILDGAHNTEGIKEVKKTIKTLFGKVDVIFSCLTRKPEKEMINELKEISNNFYKVKFPHKLSIDGIKFSHAFKKAKKPLLITGSLYFIGYVMRYYMGKPGFEPG